MIALFHAQFDLRTASEAPQAKDGSFRLSELRGVTPCQGFRLARALQSPCLYDCLGFADLDPVPAARPPAPRAMPLVLRRQFGLTLRSEPFPFPVAGSTSSANFIGSSSSLAQNTKRTISVRFSTHRSIWCTFTEPHSIRDDCVYRTAPEMNRPTAEARTESGPHSRMTRLVPASCKVGK
jgi:hypothetical protein